MFELSSLVAGDVAHNLFLDPKKNADAPSLWMDETEPQRRRSASACCTSWARWRTWKCRCGTWRPPAQDGDYSQAMADRAKDADGNLDDIEDSCRKLKPVVDGFKTIKLKLKPANKDIPAGRGRHGRGRRRGRGEESRRIEAGGPGRRDSADGRRRPVRPDEIGERLSEPAGRPWNLRPRPISLIGVQPRQDLSNEHELAMLPIPSASRLRSAGTCRSVSPWPRPTSNPC